MAIMHPKYVYHFNSLSEQRLYNALKNQLPNNYEVFYSVVWYSKDEENNRINSESDFVIVDQNKGFICIEVKGGVRYVHQDDKYIVYNSDGENIIKRISAFQQAENSMRYFLNNYENIYNSEFKGVYGFMAAFPNYEIKNDVERYFNQVKETTIDINDMENLEECIRRCFLYWNRKNQTLPELFVSESKKKLCEMFKRTYAIEASKGALIEYKNSELEKINSVQHNIINLLVNYNEFAMKGAAGTGKSWIAYQMACLNAIANSRPTLLVSKSTLLANYFRNIKNISNYTNFDIISLQQLKEKLGITDIENYQITDNNRYSVILVDEAQDFTAEEAFFIRDLLIKDKNSKFYVFYDDEQNIYSNNLDETLNKFMVDLPAFVLTENLRNTKNIYDWARERTSLGEASFSNQIDGPEPLMQSFRTINQIGKYISQVINTLTKKDKVPMEYINIVIDDDIFEEFASDSFDFSVRNELSSKNCDYISVFSTSEYKGMESNVIFYIHKKDSGYSYKYVGLTRARFFLYDIEYNEI